MVRIRYWNVWKFGWKTTLIATLEPNHFHSEGTFLYNPQSYDYISPPFLKKNDDLGKFTLKL